MVRIPDPGWFLVLPDTGASVRQVGRVCSLRGRQRHFRFIAQLFDERRRGSPMLGGLLPDEVIPPVVALPRMPDS